MGGKHEVFEEAEPNGIYLVKRDGTVS